MSYISNRLVHWAGSRKTRDEQYRLLTRDILQPKRLKFSKRFLDFGSERAGLKENTYEVSMICFTDIPFSETEAHCAKYSRFGISFDKAYLARRLACPVGYITNSLIHDNFSYIYHNLTALPDRLRSATPSGDSNDTKSIIDNVLKRLMYNVAFAQDYSREEHTPDKAEGEPLPDQQWLFEDVNTSYFEREWRMVLSNSEPGPSWITPREGEPVYFKFDEKYMGPIIMPREYIDRFKKERDEVLAEYNRNSRPPVLAYEDLRFM